MRSRFAFDGSGYSGDRAHCASIELLYDKWLRARSDHTSDARESSRAANACVEVAGRRRTFAFDTNSNRSEKSAGQSAIDEENAACEWLSRHCAFGEISQPNSVPLHDAAFVSN